MRKVLAIAILVIGAAIGVLSTAKYSWDVRFVALGVCMLFAVPIAGAVAGIGGETRAPLKIKPDFDPNSDYLPGQSTSPRDLAANYWRDEGHPPFAKPSNDPPDLHQFDPQNLD
ncbi:MAG: hypothetical protein LBE06_07580 [Azoarcus sp.]|jgi:hypothetical protein|nr:hypothetical protein [Azoarcus sp.]